MPCGRARLGSGPAGRPRSGVGQPGSKMLKRHGLPETRRTGPRRRTTHEHSVWDLDSLRVPPGYVVDVRAVPSAPLFTRARQANLDLCCPDVISTMDGAVIRAQHPIARSGFGWSIIRRQHTTIYEAKSDDTDQGSGKPIAYASPRLDQEHSHRLIVHGADGESERHAAERRSRGCNILRSIDVAGRLDGAGRRVQLLWRRCVERSCRPITTGRHTGSYDRRPRPYSSLLFAPRKPSGPDSNIRHDLH